MTEDTVKKLYVDPDGMATFICPKCGESRRESVVQYKDETGPIRVGCKCSNVYEVRLEFRKYFRKKTYLDGLYFRASQPGALGKMIVKDLSFGGCRFETMNAHMLDRGEEIRIEFELDDARRSMIRKRAVVSDIEGRSIGCKFTHPPGFVDPELGFYLRKR